jgi:hypothetical protein
MNYLEKKYGRKTVRVKPNYTRLIASWLVCLLIGFVVASAAHGFMNKPVYGSVENLKELPAVEWGGDFKPLDVPMDEDLQEYVHYLSQGYDVEFSFVMAVIEHESSFKADTISSTNDFGLMQINKVNHKWLTANLGINDFLDPYQNTKAGVHMLNDLFQKYEEPAKVLMAYNCGESGARKLWNQGIYETSYSRSIMKQAAIYESELKVNDQD